MKQTAKAYLFWAVTLFYWELILHLTAFHSLSLSVFPLLGFTLGGAGLMVFLCSFGKAGGTPRIWLIGIVYALFGTQLVYHQVFDGFLSLAFVSMGGDAMTTFGGIVLNAILHTLPQLLLMTAPFWAAILLRRKDILRLDGQSWKQKLVLLAAAVAFTLLTGALLPLMGSGVNSPAALYRSSATTVDRWVEHFGVLTTLRLDATRILTGGKVSLGGGEMDLTAGASSERNILPQLDFDALDDAADSDALRELNAYFSSRAGTGKNEYTGLFEGYNLIEICGEAFSPYLVDEELTPTLYKLCNGGIVFENFYNSFPNLTTNGEYTLCMGLMPDLSRMSFATSTENYLPFCMGRMFSNEGIPARAYHNNAGTFYNRVNTHTNMGYDFSAVNFGLELTLTTPTSDLEMLEQTVDDYIGETPFHAYYMTYSGHADYSTAANAMSAKNWDRVANVDAPDEVKAYLAANLELEDALTYLIGRLEEAGVADKTVIVLTGDHSPYGLSEESYRALAGDAVNEVPYWQYKNAFVCWTPSLEQPIYVGDYCCTQDILPTLLNLFGFDYDSRLLTGRDVLSDCTHVALLKDGSFLSDAFFYDSGTGTVTWRLPVDSVPPEGSFPPEDSFLDSYAENLIAAVTNDFAVSAAILGTDYYGFAYEALGLADPNAGRQTFSSYADISGTWYEQEVELLTSHGVLSGNNTGAFGGEQPASRADCLAMLTRSLQLSGVGLDCPYLDVPEGQWYREPVAAACAAGLLSPEENALFRPSDNITFSELEEFLTAAARYGNLPQPEEWAVETVSAVKARMAEQETGESEAVPRGAAAVTAARLIEAMEQAE